MSLFIYRNIIIIMVLDYYSSFNMSTWFLDCKLSTCLYQCSTLLWLGNEKSNILA